MSSTSRCQQVIQTQLPMMTQALDTRHKWCHDKWEHSCSCTRKFASYLSVRAVGRKFACSSSICLDIILWLTKNGHRNKRVISGRIDRIDSCAIIVSKPTKSVSANVPKCLFWFWRAGRNLNLHFCIWLSVPKTSILRKLLIYITHSLYAEKMTSEQSERALALAIFKPAAWTRKKEANFKFA